MGLSVIIPAANEGDQIGPCLAALFASDPVLGGAEAVVVANGCTDDTAPRAREMAAAAKAAGWGLTVLDLPTGGKPAALDAGDAAARGAARAYLDADVRVTAPLMAQIAQALDTAAPRYATGSAAIPPAESAVSRAYARFWQRLPFARDTAPGYGLFATNTAGRARWGTFPAIISDDTFVRLHFAPDERIQCAATYSWPIIEGFGPLVRVRRRQDAGVREIAARFPDLMRNDCRPALGPGGLMRLALADPAGFAAYAAVSLSVRMRPAGAGWTRGR